MKNRIKKVTIVFMVLFIIVSGIYVFYERHLQLEENKRIESARNALMEANSTKDSDDISNAKNLIETIKTEDVKEELSLSVVNLEISIDKDNVSKELDALVENVNSSLKQEDLNSLILKIKEIEYDDIKDAYLKKTDDIQSKINDKVAKEKERLEKLNYENRMKAIDAMKIVSTVPSDVKVLETLNGKVTAFTPYCSDGCHGYTASGRFVGNGDIYYQDREFGTVHIVAGDSSYPFGTIVRLKNVGYFGGDIYAIVLDRGGAIGKGRRALFDLLFATETSANRFGVTSVTCEILRIGY